MKHSRCIFIDGETSCGNNPKYIVDIFTEPDKQGYVGMPLIGFECCEKHLRWAEESDNRYILKNIIEKDKQYDTNQ